MRWKIILDNFPYMSFTCLMNRKEKFNRKNILLIENYSKNHRLQEKFTHIVISEYYNFDK